MRKTMDNEEECGSFADFVKFNLLFTVGSLGVVAFFVLFFAGIAEWIAVAYLRAISGVPFKEALLAFLSITTIWGKLALATPPLFVIGHVVETWIRLSRRDRLEENLLEQGKETEKTDGEK